MTATAIPQLILFADPTVCAWFLRGTRPVRSRPCGKPNCHCARGQLHASLYLVQSRRGKLRQLSIPRQWEDRVRQTLGLAEKGLAKISDRRPEPRIPTAVPVKAALVQCRHKRTRSRQD